MTSVLAATRLANREEQLIGKVVASGLYMNTSEFIREAVREKLARMGETKVVVIREIDKKQAKDEIYDYFKNHPGSYVSDAADALGIDIELAFEAANELLNKDKKVEKSAAY
ncbi:MAG: ribbon-helix-helix domain-containing protein [Candidatus Micrarchaeota archaeon]